MLVNNKRKIDKRISEGIKYTTKFMAAVVLSVMAVSVLALAVVPTFVNNTTAATEAGK